MDPIPLTEDFNTIVVIPLWGMGGAATLFIAAFVSEVSANI